MLALLPASFMLSRETIFGGSFRSSFALFVPRDVDEPCKALIAFIPDWNISSGDTPVSEMRFLSKLDCSSDSLGRFAFCPVFELKTHCHFCYNCSYFSKKTQIFSSLLYNALENVMSSVIRQKGESQNGGNKKAKYAKFSKKRTFLTS